MAVRFGSARIDENGNISGGRPGDQTGKEVAIENGYIHGLGWIVLRPKSAADANGIANSMRRICENDNHGYSQANRYSGLKNGVASKTKDDLDCSSAVRLAIKDATGKDVGEFYTGNEKSVLLKSGLFTEVKFTSLSSLCVGDVLVTKTKGHTVVVVEGVKRPVEPAKPKRMDCCIQAAYNATPSQLWTLVHHDGGLVEILNANGLALDVSGGTTRKMENGREVYLHKRNGTPAQLWRLIPSDLGGHFIASSIDESFVLDNSGGTMAARASVRLHKRQEMVGNQYAQVWEVVAPYGGEGRFAIRNRKSMFVLDANPNGYIY